MDESLSTSVLIVDDSAQYAGMLKRILCAGFGYENVSTVESIEVAYDMLRSDPGKFELLFVDYNFPDGSTGGDLLERLARESLLEGRVAFLITANPTLENMKQAAAAGALGVVAKPFNREDLKAKLQIAQRSILSRGQEF